ncbi:hypothetical protein WJX73_002985 [Symbiochloris irregularis]|uniref:tRNA pseudouridine synthase n=1 Tax=Symbiochloris irregularis TaxID=706552 RepID=A0AAW1NXV4_9CHLO
MDLPGFSSASCLPPGAGRRMPICRSSVYLQIVGRYGPYIYSQEGYRSCLYTRKGPFQRRQSIRSLRQSCLTVLQALPGDWPWPDVNYKAVIMYDGTRFNGFQLNPSGRTVQAVLERALCLTRQEARESMCLHAAGRTDSGVHARGQVISFRSGRLDEDMDLMQRKLNSCMPPDARVASVQIVPPDFSARFSAVRKQYVYTLQIRTVLDPMCRAYCMHIPGELDPDVMRQAAAQFVGLHDFSQFASASRPLSNSYRGWNAAKPQGLCLQRVDYPSHADPFSFAHPDLQHDASGRVARVGADVSLNL